MEIPEKDFNAWLEDTVRYIYESDAKTMALVSINEDGESMTSYYNAGVSGKVMLASKMLADVVVETVMINAPYIKQAIEDCEDEESE